LYKFIFSFLVPVIRTTRQVRKSFRHMNEQMNGQMNAGNQPSGKTEKNQPSPKKEDYIDFEEIKD
jgi:hypothetical protein